MIPVLGFLSKARESRRGLTKREKKREKSEKKRTDLRPKSRAERYCVFVRIDRIDRCRSYYIRFTFVIGKENERKKVK